MAAKGANPLKNWQNAVSGPKGGCKGLSSAETSIWTSSTSSSCFEDHTSWAPMDMVNTVATKEDDAFSCQKRCESVDGCTHFSYFKSARDCHLQDAFAIKQEPSPGFLSGPFKCWEDIKNQDQFFDVGNQTYLPKQIGCFKMGVLYSPILGVPRYFAPSNSG